MNYKRSMAVLLAAVLFTGCSGAAVSTAPDTAQTPAAAEVQEESGISETEEEAVAEAEVEETVAEAEMEEAEAEDKTKEDAAEEAMAPKDTASGEEAEKEEPALSDNTFTATVNSVGGPLTVAVTMNDERIEAIDILDCADTVGIADIAIARLTSEIIDNQSVNVDAVAGATLTSVFFKSAVTDAIKASGADKANYSEKITWSAPAQSDMEADVVIVGGGLAGMSAAAEAAGLGLDVILVEKLAYLGGDGLVSDQGVVNTFLAPVDEAFPAAVESFAELGVPISLADYPGYGENVAIALENTGDFDVLYTLTTHLREAAEKKGAQFITDTPATGLIIEDGAVTGVTAQPKGQDEFKIEAKAVILCTGGFSANRELVSTYLDYADGARAIGLGGTTGDALEWVKEAGGAYKDLDAGDSSFMLMNPNTGVAASFGMFGNNYVDKDGVLVVEDSSYNLGAEAVYMAVGSEKVWNVLSASDAEANALLPFLEKSVHNGTAVVCKSMKDIAETFEMDSIEKTLTDLGYTDDETWYVMEGVAGIYGTYGGVAVDIDSRVINEDGDPVPGLYAAGEVIGSREYQTNGAYGGGLAPAFAVGYVAANTACADISK